MRKALLFVAAICCLSSCMVNQAKIQPIRDKYPLHPTERVYSYSYDDVWSNVIDFFATNGLSIKIIDKQSGLILSEKVSFMDVGTYEKYKEPGVSNPNAFVVIERKGISPNRVDGEWNVRVKKVGDKTSVKVNIVQLRADYVGGSSLFSGTVFDVRSTGVFEKMILDGIEGK